jgi:hypothetical protein
MDRRRLLAGVSAAQLAVGLTGMAVAVRRSRPYDFLILHGRADRVGRDSIAMGTPLSAPPAMLVAQGVATGVLARRSSPPAERVLAGLGAAMVVGYLGESLVRRRLRPSGFDGVESPLAVAGTALAAAMPIMARGVGGRR